MMINRREFLALTANFVALCAPMASVAGPAGKERLVNVGPAARYAADGVYGGFTSQGFFIVRQGEKVFALSAICTHKKCKLKSQPDHSFYCPCHGSSFDSAGHVKRGPAKRDLPVFATTVDDRGRLLVTIPAR